MPVWRHFMPLKSARFLIGRLNQPKACGLAPPIGQPTTFSLRMSTRSANILKLSCSVRLAGQVDWNLYVFTPAGAAGCCAPAGAAKVAATANAISEKVFFMVPPSPRYDDVRRPA